MPHHKEADQVRARNTKPTWERRLDQEIKRLERKHPNLRTPYRLHSQAAAIKSQEGR
jgi:hypothetical protein